MSVPYDPQKQAAKKTNKAKSSNNNTISEDINKYVEYYQMLWDTMLQKRIQRRRGRQLAGGSTEDDRDNMIQRRLQANTRSILRSIYLLRDEQINMERWHYINRSNGRNPHNERDSLNERNPQVDQTEPHAQQSQQQQQESQLSTRDLVILNVDRQLSRLNNTMSGARLDAMAQVGRQRRVLLDRFHNRTLGIGQQINNNQQPNTQASESWRSLITAFRMLRVRRQNMRIRQQAQQNGGQQ